jgi:hypothetical protein
MGLITLQNDTVQVYLDAAWPRIAAMGRGVDGPQARGVLAGCPPEQPFSLELNGALFTGDQLTCVASPDGETAADYRVEVAELGLTLHFRFALAGETLRLTLPEVREAGAFRLETLYIPEHRLISGLAAQGDRFYRYGHRRITWSRHWCPGNGEVQPWEDIGAVADAVAERGHRETRHACVWNATTCAAIRASIYIDPLVSAIDGRGSTVQGRAGRVSLWAGRYAYRLRGTLAEPFFVEIALLGDYDGSGEINYCDAANWEGDRRLERNPTDYYHETLTYKIYLDDQMRPEPLRTFANCLEVIRTIHAVSGGLKQIVYLVGWQYTGHDSGFPEPTYINPRVGGPDGLRELVEAARAYNAIISVHSNLDDSYEHYPGHNPELLSRDPDGKLYLWFNNDHFNGLKVYSINHTLQVETGYIHRQLEQHLALLNPTYSIHFDAHRTYNETWLPDGTHIDAECEMQRGLIPIKRLFAEHGLDITTEGGEHGLIHLYRWVWIMPDWHFGYLRAMSHGRVRFYHRPGYIRDALGRAFIWEETDPVSFAAIGHNFFSQWMYAELLHRKRMVAYRVGQWDEEAEAWYADETYVSTGRTPRTLYARYEGIDIARGQNRFLPWREDTIYVYSPEGGIQTWTLPPEWGGQSVRASQIIESGETPLPAPQMEGRQIHLELQAGIPVVLRRG